MIANDVLEALRDYAQSLERDVTFVLASGTHEKRDELVDFLTDVCSVSDRLTLEERSGAGLRSPLSFTLESAGAPTGVTFSGIPGGHEFNSLALAMLQSGGVALNLDDRIQSMVQRVRGPAHFEVVVSLSCQNCPDVVQTLNQFAQINAEISTEMLDGGLFPDLIAERDIQGVPSVYLNGELFANGKVDPALLIDKLQEYYPEITTTEPFEDLPEQDVTVIGGGPAGISAAIYAARKGLAVTLVAETLGGQVKDTQGIENLISVSHTTGEALVGALRGHLGNYDVTLRENVRVAALDATSPTKQVSLATGETISTRTLILATGARWRELGVPGEKENVGNGVAYCPHCDGPFFKGKDVAVVGGGNSGIEAALDLAGIVKSVTVLEFLADLKADQVLIDQAEARANISILTNVATKQIEALAGKVTGITWEERDTGNVETTPLAGVFVQIGLLPNSQMVAGQLEITAHGEVVIDEKCGTSVPGVYACGDVTTVPYKQIVVSIGEGAKAALAAFEYLLVGTDVAA